MTLLQATGYVALGALCTASAAAFLRLLGHYFCEAVDKILKRG